jgi:hypothetical protein
MMEQFGGDEPQGAENVGISHGLEQPRLRLDMVLNHFGVIRASVVYEASVVGATHLFGVCGGQAELVDLVFGQLAEIFSGTLMHGFVCRSRDFPTN